MVVVASASLGGMLAVAFASTSAGGPSAPASVISPAAPVAAAPSPVSAHSTPGVQLPAPQTTPSPSSASTGSPFTFPTNFHLPFVQPSGPRPNSWGDSALPPGVIQPTGTSPSLAGWGNTSSSDASKYCYGIWPDGGQSVYANYDCYGADEPGVDFYSPLSGSGGNITWNVTLPVDRSPVLNQSNLYSAIWFGLTLRDPYAYMDACFLELQFYPDSSWYAPGPSNPSDTVYGQWVGEAVAWQIEAATGAEDPCFISPLFTNGTFGPGFFNMSQGDHILVKMSGWSNDPWGENLTISDVTKGTYSLVNLYNRTGAYSNEYNENDNYVTGTPLYPLDPAYNANNVENGLPWTPGGELPATFAFEVGHSGNPTAPETNPYGGCSPGQPPSNPSTPCPSYDPGSWMNNTLVPWQIAAPTFSNGTTSMTPAQIGFHQDIGAQEFIDNESTSAVTTACIGLTPGAWCDYPWYSYSCSEKAFNFGATDYAKTTDDFGQDNEYSYQTQYDDAGLGFYPPQNFSIPTCGGSSYTVDVGTVAGDGTVYFLTHGLTNASTAIAGVGPGEYSINAIPDPGDAFLDWVVTGGVTVGNASTPWTSLNVSGSGTVSADFAVTGVGTVVTFDASPTSGSIEIVPGYEFSSAVGAHETNGAVSTVAAGTDGILAIPAAGYNFSSWSVTGTSIAVASTILPYTSLFVQAGGLPATLTANFVATSIETTFVAEDYIGAGTVNFDGHGNVATGTYSNILIGGYSITATPAAGWSFVQWAFGGNMEMVNLADASDYLALQQTPSYSIVGAVFAFDLTIDDSATSDGVVAIASLALLPAPSGATYQVSPGNYTLAAAPNPGYQFSDWTVSSSTAMWAEEPDQAITVLELNGTGTVTAHFAAASSTTTVFLNETPATGGVLLFNYAEYGSGSSRPSTGAGVYVVFAFELPGYTFAGWTTGDFTGSVTFDQAQGDAAIISISTLSSSGSITASYTPEKVPVTFVGFGTATVNSVVVQPGTSVGEFDGSYSLSLTPPTNTTFIGWAVQGGAVASSTSMTTTLNVTGPTLVEALETPSVTFSVGAVSILPSTTVTTGTNLTISVAVPSGSAPYHFSWVAPAGCGSPDTQSFTCAPTGSGTYEVTANVTDAFGTSILSAAVQLVVTGPLTVGAFSISPGLISLGAPVNLTVIAVGGTTPYTYAYSGLPGCTSLTVASGSCTPTASGNFTVEATVTDHAGIVRTANATLDVNPALVLEYLNASPAALTKGTATLLAGEVHGGTAPYSYVWEGLPTGCAGANQSSISCTPGATGSFNVTLFVNDSGGGRDRMTTTVVVNALPTISSFSASPNSVAAGTEFTLTVVVAGGTGPFTFSYADLPADCPSQNTSTFSCTSKDSGQYNVTVTVTDVDGKTAHSTTPVAVTSLPGGTGGSGSSGGGLSSTDWILIAVVIAAVVVAIAVVLMRRKPPAAAPTGAAAAPPAASGSAPAGAAPPPWSEEKEQIYGDTPKGN